MVDTAVKFDLVDNKSFHDKLESCILDEPVDASRSIFVNLITDPTGKCYYPFFFREPFSIKDIDFCKFIEPEHLQKLKDRKIIPLVCMTSESWTLLHLNRNRIFRNSPYFNVINQLVKHDIREEDVVWLICNKYQPTDTKVKANTWIIFSHNKN